MDPEKLERLRQFAQQRMSMEDPTVIEDRLATDAALQQQRYDAMQFADAPVEASMVQPDTFLGGAGILRALGRGIGGRLGTLFARKAADDIFGVADDVGRAMYDDAASVISPDDLPGWARGQADLLPMADDGAGWLASEADLVPMAADDLAKMAFRESGTNFGGMPAKSLASNPTDTLLSNWPKGWSIK